MKRTYIDASVLIAAFQGKTADSQRALRVLDDPDRELVFSDYLRLELLTKALLATRVSSAPQSLANLHVRGLKWIVMNVWEVHCDMTNGGWTYERLSFSKYNGTYENWTLVSSTMLQDAVIQAAFIWAYNSQEELINIVPWWN